MCVDCIYSSVYKVCVDLFVVRECNKWAMCVGQKILGHIMNVMTESPPGRRPVWKPRQLVCTGGLVAPWLGWCSSL